MWANGNDAVGWLQCLNAFFLQNLVEKPGSALSVTALD
jgi:hypothetical protein